MEFCPKCGAILVQKTKNFGCPRCNYSSKNKTALKTSEKINEKNANMKKHIFGQFKHALQMNQKQNFSSA